jgi:DNA primase
VKPALKPAQFHIGNLGKRLAKKDPWADFFDSRQPLEPALKAIRSL